MEQAQILDLGGLQCPLPVLKARKALQSLEGGAVLAVIVTDQAAPADFRAFCAAQGHEFLSCTEQAGGSFRIKIRKKAD